jgi:hypothetical protein
MALKDKWALDDEYRSTPKFQDQKHRIGNNNNNNNNNNYRMGNTAKSK